MKLPLIGLALSLTSLTALAPLASSAQEPVGAQHPPSAKLPMRAEPKLPDAKLAVFASKILTCAEEGPLVVDHGVLLMSAGKIEAVGRAGELEVPEGYEVVDVGDNWLMPGFIDLHAHIAGSFDINDTVFLTNPGVRAYTSVVPGNATLMRALAGGVTSILFIPGSGSNIGGVGVLLKTGLPDYESMEIRNPGSMKLAQSGNPERFAFGVARTFMNWHTRETLTRGVAYANEWAAFERGERDEPDIDVQFEVFRWLVPQHAQVSAHTQIYQVVLESLTMLKQEFDLPLFIDHGTIGAWRLGGLAKELGVAAALGPRNVDTPQRGFMNWAGNIEAEGWRGVLAGYQQTGMTELAFNTDSPVIPQEELLVQVSIAARFGFTDTNMETVRGLTIIPARIANISHRTGSLEVGKDADILVISGHPADPRSAIERIWIEGHDVYDAAIKRDF